MSNCQNWMAWIDHRPRPTPVVRVQGDCDFPPGTAVELRRPQAPPPDAAAPFVRGPVLVQRGGSPPTFTVDPSPNRFYALEVSVDPALFSRRPTAPSGETFYATWQDNSLLSSPQVALPNTAWVRLQSANYLFYRVTTSARADAWADVGSSDAGIAPGQGSLLAIADSTAALSAPDHLTLVCIVSTPQTKSAGGKSSVRAAYAEATRAVYRYATVLPDAVSLEFDDVY